MTDPIGELIIDAGERAKKKASKTHSSEAACGCQVTVSWFSEGGSTVGIDRCSDHPVRAGSASKSG